MRNKPKYEVCEKIALDTFEKIKVSFPHLEMKLDLEDPHVDINMDIKKQRGLDFDVNLNLQNMDELHISASALWVEWFPCTNPEEVEGYMAAVNGVLSGKYRILEHIKDQKAIKAELQRPADDGWETIATWSTVYWPSIKKKTFNIVQNDKAYSQIINENSS